MCCHPQLELGRFECLQAPHGNWEVEGGHTGTVGNKTRVSMALWELLESGGVQCEGGHVGGESSDEGRGHKDLTRNTMIRKVERRITSPN